MTDHTTGTREAWLAARLELLEAEKELTRRSDELARRRQELPWVRIDKEYRFETDEGTASLADLFRGRSQLLVYHFMFGPEYTAGCPSCSAIADGFDGFVVHLANHDVTLVAVSRAPLAKLQGYKRRMGWRFPWASSLGSDFNYDFQAAFTQEQQQSGVVEYNFRAMDVRPPLEAGKESPVAKIAAGVGTDLATFTRDEPHESNLPLVIPQALVNHVTRHGQIDGPVRSVGQGHPGDAIGAERVLGLVIRDDEVEGAGAGRVAASGGNQTHQEGANPPLPHSLLSPHTEVRPPGHASPEPRRRPNDMRISCRASSSRPHMRMLASVRVDGLDRAC
jgi:predicted dithiol-disulfide oxidoreductase (DUF899 family)